MSSYNNINVEIDNGQKSDLGVQTDRRHLVMYFRKNLHIFE